MIFLEVLQLRLDTNPIMKFQFEFTNAIYIVNIFNIRIILIAGIIVIK